MSDKQKAKATNPFTGETLSEHDFISKEDLEKKIQESWNVFLKFKKSDPKERAQKLKKLGEIIERDSDKYAKIITMEMGKPIKEARREVEYAINECKFFGGHLEEFMKPEEIKTKAKRSYVSIEPLGPIYHVTPFNFPFWLLFRGTVAAMAMGNTVINKNPQTCPQCGIAAEEAFKEAGFTNGEFMNLIISQDQSEDIIKNPSIRGVSFTGSTEGGVKVASWAGQYCKKSVMELGGNDPFIVLKDADMDLAIEQGVQGRLLNGGQCCTAAKRFIVDESIYEEFKNRLIEKVKDVKVGDPMDENTQVGPLAKKSGLEKAMDQVKKAKEAGAKVLLGGDQPKDEKLKKGHYMNPTILETSENNPVFDEETFGPIFNLIKFKTEEDALRIANKTKYGLGGAIFTRDEERAQELGRDLEVGALFINNMVDWNASTPEGGVKMSGYGREGGKQGAHEFVNVKTVWIA